MFLDLGTIDRSRFDGLLVVPDVHGHPDALESARDRARRERLFLVQLGDLVDRGPSSAMAVAVARELEREGEGTFLVGNHEHKLAGLVREGHYATPRRLETRDELDRYGEGLLDWYVKRIEESPLWARAPKLLLAHAAFHTEMLAAEPRVTEAVRTRCLFGVRVAVADQRRPTRSRDWVHEIPVGLTVVVGHDVVSTEAPVIETGKRRGRAYMLDTGGWRQGGTWSSLVVRWDDIF